MGKYNVTALVPMKAHSSRIPNKNIKKFINKPLYYHILQKLINCKYIREICINTDSKIIANHAPKLSKKIKINIRPKSLRGDFVSMNKIIAYDLSKSNNEFFLQTHSTNPLLKTKTMNSAIEKFFKKRKKYDSLVSVTLLQTRLYNHKFKALNHNPMKLIRTQDLKPLFEENSNIYIFSKKSFRKYNNRIGHKPQLFIINKLEAIDIDTPSEFKLAQEIKKIY